MLGISDIDIKPKSLQTLLGAEMAASRDGSPVAPVLVFGYSV